MGKREIRKKKMKKALAVGAAVLALAAVVVAIAVVPTAMVNSRFDKIFDTVEDMAEPEIVVTDMGAENNFSGAAGEMLVTGDAALKILNKLSNAADDFEYVGKEKAEGSFDVRFKVSENETIVEIYLTAKGMYYVKGGNKYLFEPENADAKVEYKQVYNTACAFVK